MTHPVTGIDHVFLLVQDLDEAARRYRALGFTLSPRGLHSAAKGSANHTIMFPQDYFELLGIVAPTDGNAARRQSLESMGEGLHAIACRVEDAAAAGAALADAGIATRGLGSFERPVPLPGGGSGVAAFTTLSFDPGELPFGTVFMCQHLTRETVWLPELLDHPNTACGLDAILALSEDPQADAGRFARLWADGRVMKSAGGATVDTGPASAPLSLLERGALHALYPGLDLDRTPKGGFTALRIRVRDMHAAQACLAAGGISAIPTTLGLAIAPQDACGMILEFVPE
jgi:catechol 2,3-dioxygenase-like lactoylglutathione lyase family enzyme